MYGNYKKLSKGGINLLNYILLEIVLSILFIYMHTKIRHGVHMLQLEYYKNDRYKSWIKKNKKVVFSLRDVLLFIGTIVTLINIKANFLLFLSLNLCNFIFYLFSKLIAQSCLYYV